MCLSHPQIRARMRTIEPSALDLPKIKRRNRIYSMDSCREYYPYIFFVRNCDETSELISQSHHVGSAELFHVVFGILEEVEVVLFFTEKLLEELFGDLIFLGGAD